MKKSKNNKYTVVLRIAALFVCLSVMLSLFGCVSEEQEADILNEFMPLYESSLEINDIIYGGGLAPSVELTEEQEAELKLTEKAYFVPVASDCKYKSKAELESAILAVYDSSYYNEILKFTAFLGYGAEGDDPHPRYKEIDGELCVNVFFSPFNLSGERVVDRAEVTSVSSGVATIRTPYILNGKESEKSVTMRLTENGWRLCDPTF